MTSEIRVTKIDAARRQLRTAIHLWSTDGDAVSTHTLARAAFQIIHDLNRKNKGPVLLFDSEIVKPEFRKASNALLRAPSDFMKHADRGTAGMLKEITFNPDLSRGFILFAIIGLRHLRQDIGADEVTFELWHFVHKPEIFSDAGKKTFEKIFDAVAVGALRRMSKREFFERTGDVVRQSFAEADSFLARAHSDPPTVLG